MAKCSIRLIILLLLPFTISCWFFNPNRCNPGCVRVYQWPSGFAGLHIPKFTVQIINEVWDAKGVYDVQVLCPGFASTTLIDPAIFRRVGFANCILKNGNTIKPGEVITFEYSNVLPYPLAAISMKCL